MKKPVSLRGLLQAVADEGVSTRQMQQRVEAEERRRPRGMRLTHSTAAQILNGKYKSRPSDATIRAVAYLAQVADHVAFEAADRAAPGLPFADELPDEIDQLSPKRRKLALEVLRSLIEAEQLEHQLVVLQTKEGAELADKGDTPHADALADYDELARRRNALAHGRPAEAVREEYVASKLRPGDLVSDQVPDDIGEETQIDPNEGE